MHKNEIYDYICRVLTEYENGETSEIELYHALVIVQNEWETTITADC